MPITIRYLEGQDYEPAITLFRTLEPERSRETEYWHEEDQKFKNDAKALRRWVALDEREGRVVGYASCWHMQLWKYRMDLLVHPDWRRRGVGADLFNALLENLKRTEAGTVQARAHEAASESLRFLERRNFVEIHRMRKLRLDLREADFSALDGLAERLTTEGIMISTLDREEVEDAAVWSKLSELQNAVTPDWPDPDPGGPPKVWTEDECKRFLCSEHSIREALFIAKADDQYVGYSGLGRYSSEPGIIDSGPTAVRPEYRELGIATRLKVQCLAYAQQQGFTAAISHSANPGMIHVNEKVGFQREAAVVRLVRRLNSGE